MYALALAGAAGSPSLFRCDLRARCSKTLCFTGFCGRGRSTIWTVAKCKNRGFYKGGVGNGRRPDVRTWIFFSDGPVSTQMAQNAPQDEPTEAPRIGPRCVNIAPSFVTDQSVINQLLPTNCLQRVVANQLLPTSQDHIIGPDNPTC